MSAPLSAEQRLAVSRAQCLTALRQPTWLLLAQRLCKAPTHAPNNQDAESAPKDFLDRCIESFFDPLHSPHISQRQDDHAQHHGPG